MIQTNDNFNSYISLSIYISINFFKVTYQNLFRLFPKLSGMTGTALTDAEELAETYQLKGSVYRYTSFPFYIIYLYVICKLLLSIHLSICIYIYY